MRDREIDHYFSFADWDERCSCGKPRGLSPFDGIAPTDLDEIECSYCGREFVKEEIGFPVETGVWVEDGF